jgi:hypothetical protein
LLSKDCDAGAFFICAAILHSELLCTDSSKCEQLLHSNEEDCL